MKLASYHISFIGAGNLAWHLAPALENAGHYVKEVYSLNGLTAKNLVANLYDATLKSHLDFSDSTSQIFIIAATDDAIETIAQELILPDLSLLVHTSGTKPIENLEYSAAAASGVFYPLQSFSKSRSVNFEQIPILIESESKEAIEILKNLGKSISKHVKFVSSEQRAKLHLAAVFANNFTNHLLSISETIAKEAKVDFSILKPLIVETVEKSLTLSPKRAQTGPAKRGDIETLDKHMELLSDNEALQEIYKVISQHILDNS